MTGFSGFRVLGIAFVALAALVFSAESALAQLCFTNTTPCPRTVAYFTSAGTLHRVDVPAMETVCQNNNPTVVAISINGGPFVSAPAPGQCEPYATACTNEICRAGGPPNTYVIF